MELTINNDGGVILEHGGYKVNQSFNTKVGRFYVWLPKHSGLRERFDGRDRMFRSHFVYLMTKGLDRVPFGYVIHHIDHDRTNDDLSNLALITAQDHDKHHRYAKQEPIFKGKKHSEETLALMRARAIERGNHDIWGGAKTTHSQETKEKMSTKASGCNNPAYRRDIDDEKVREFYRTCGNINRTAAEFNCSATAIRNRVKGVVPIKKAPNSKKIKDLKELVCYAALNGIDRCSERFGISREEVVLKIKRHRGGANA